MIKRIRIRNFKSLVDVTVEPGPVCVLIGKSGTGKSNFVQAIEFLRRYLMQTEPHLTPADLRSIQNAKLRNGGKSVATEFEVLLELPGQGSFEYQLSLALGSNEIDILKERLLAGSDVVFHDEGYTLIHPPDLQASGRPYLGRTHNSTTSRLVFHALTGGIGVYEIPNTVMAQRSLPAVQQGDDWISIFSTLAKENRDGEVISILRCLNSSIAWVEPDSPVLPSKIKVAHQFNGTQVLLEIDQESNGFRRFFAHLLALYQSPPKQTLLFEEPENGIYTGALSLLAHEFRTAYERGRGQVILTTHHPELLNSFDADEIRVVEIQNGATTINPLASDQRDSLKEKLLYPGELFTVTEPMSATPEPVAE